MPGEQVPMMFIPFGGMNQEDSVVNPSKSAGGQSPFAAGDYLYAQNVRTGGSRENNNGDAEYLRDTLQVQGYKVWNGSAWIDGDRPTGVNTEIGKLEDSKLRRLFVVYHNTNGNHAVCEYRYDENAVYELIKWTFGFSKTYVSLARFGDYLVFCGKGFRPRIININTIAALKSTLGSKFIEYHVSFAKWAPVAPPVCKIVTGTQNTKFTSSVYQFSYRYIYVGGFRSTWSPIASAVAALSKYLNISAISLTYPGLIANSLVPNDPITHNDEEFYRVVDYIEFAYRGSSIDIWRIFARTKVDKTGAGANITQNFTNNVVGTAADPSDFSQDYDEVPIESRSCEVIDNRVMFGNNLTEHEFVDEPDLVEATAIYTDGGWTSMSPSDFTLLDSTAKSDLANRNYLRQLSFKARGIYKLAIEFKDQTGKKSLAYTSDLLTFTIPDSPYNWPYPEPFYAIGFRLKTGFVPPSWAHSYQILRSNCQNIDYFMYGITNKFKYMVDDTAAINDLSAQPTDVQDIFNNYFDASAPESYNLSQRLQTAFRKTKEVGTSSTPADLAKASRVYIDVNNWYSAAKDNGVDVNSPFNKLYYEYRQGDRVRFWGSSASTTPSNDQKIIFDLPILEFTGRAIIIEKPLELLWLPQRDASELPRRFYIEVYRPKPQLKAEDTLFYEMGEWYPILNPGTPSRAFSKTDWTYTSAATITATLYNQHYIYNKLPVFCGDVHNVFRNYYYDYVGASAAQTGKVLSQFVPSMNPDKNLVFGRWERANGRINTSFVSPPIVTSIESEIRFGGKYLQDAIFNSTNNFRSSDRYIYPQEYGAITELINTTSYQVESVGSVLLVLASVKSFSVYINRTTMEDLGGRTQVLLSDKVLGAFNSLVGDFGCVNPESISFSVRGPVYWWDQINGGWIRYARDGLTNISEEYKMGSWFRGIADLLSPYYALTEDQRPWVISEFDPVTKELIVLMWQPKLVDTYRGYPEYRGHTFNEKSNDWKYVHNYIARMYGRINRRVMGLSYGATYIHEAGEGYGTLYGAKVPARIEPVFNIAPTSTKNWLAIIQYASHKWGIERTLSEYWGSRLQQESRMDTVDNLLEKEGGFFINFSRDRNTPNQADPDLAGMQGDALKSKVLQVLLKLDETVTSRSLLYQVGVTITDSPKNP